MILSFKEKFPDGTPTCFIERIWIGLQNEGRKANSVLARLYQIGDYIEYFSAYEEKFGTKWDGWQYVTIADTYPKLHTIRAGQRWKAGDKIHFCINARSKKYFQFAPVMEVVSVQEISIKYERENTFPTVFMDGFGQAYYYAYHYPLDRHFLNTLAQNDGFPSVEAFFEWFDKDFTGQIIHWTPLRY